jgi:hypothetical protein
VNYEEEGIHSIGNDDDHYFCSINNVMKEKEKKNFEHIDRISI